MYIKEEIKMGILISKNDVLNLFKSEFHGRKSIDQHKEWFPIHSSPSLAGIVGDLMSDGHLQGHPRWRFDFTSGNINELKRFDNEIFKQFNLKGKIRSCTGNKWGNSFNIGFNCKLLGRILNLTGVPTGCKVKKEFFVPEWILNDKKCFRVFIGRVFDCEGSVSTERNPFINLEMWKSEKILKSGIKFFKQIRDRLKIYFEIETNNIYLVSRSNIRKDGIKTHGIRLRIKRLDSLIKFQENIGFQNIGKQNKLKQIINRKMGRKRGGINSKELPHAQPGRAHMSKT